MNIFKRIKILVLVLAPASLMGAAQPSSAWMQEVLSAPQSGAWIVQDRTGKTVLVEGEIISSNDRVISSEDVASLFADVMQGTFVNIYDVSKLFWFYSKVNNLVAGKDRRDRLYDAYIQKMSMPVTQAGGEIYYIFTVSDVLEGSKKLLGAVLFDVQKDFLFGTVELDLISLIPETQSRGLSTILASSIFKILPQTKRIILDVLQNNTNAIRAYEHFGFTRYDKRNWVVALLDPEYHYEYLTEKPTSQRLQACAAKFNAI